jgi:site-specific recombinase XerD
MILTEITGIQITKYLSWLRFERPTKSGKPLSATYTKHHYIALAAIFNYAERQEFIDKNPMRKVDAPKITKRPVDALSEDETAVFFTALSSRPLELRCILQLLMPIKS